MAEELRRMETEKRLHEIQTWKDKKKAEVDNRAEKDQVLNVTRKKAHETQMEAERKKIPIKAEEYVEKLNEKIKNEEAHVLKVTEDRKVRIEAGRKKGHNEIDKKAEKYLSTNTVPTEGGCFGC